MENNNSLLEVEAAQVASRRRWHIHVCMLEEQCAGAGAAAAALPSLSMAA
jgi:hypothetical protein